MTSDIWPTTNFISNFLFSWIHRINKKCKNMNVLLFFKCLIDVIKFQFKNSRFIYNAILVYAMNVKKNKQSIWDLINGPTICVAFRISKKSKRTRFLPFYILDVCLSFLFLYYLYWYIKKNVIVLFLWMQFAISIFHETFESCAETL